MWIWILLAVVVPGAGLTTWLICRHLAAGVPSEIALFVDRLAAEIDRCGEEFGVRGLVPGTLTMIVSVRGQEVPVPLENLHRHYATFPDQLPVLVRQLLSEIVEVALERPIDHEFCDAAMRILPQICPTSWVYANAPAFGDSAIVHREFGPDLSICYVIDDPWSVVFVCQAHLRLWGRSEDDVSHLANQNLRRMSGAEPPMPDDVGGPVRVRSGDGYDAARVLLLDPDKASDLLIALPERDTLYLGREEDRHSMVSLMDQERGRCEHPVSSGLYRLEAQRLVPVQ